MVEKAAVSEGSTAEAQRRAAACGKALDLHLTRLRCDDKWLSQHFGLHPTCSAFLWRVTGAAASTACLAVQPGRRLRILLLVWSFCNANAPPAPTLTFPQGEAGRVRPAGPGRPV